MTKRLFIVTGELSGDLHASNVVEELKKLLPDIIVEGVGSVNMQNQGVKLFHDHSEMSVIGLDALKKIPSHVKLGQKILNYLKSEFKPDLVLLIDYGGFNLRLAEHLKKNHFKVFYFIAPQIWASRKGRLKKIAAYIDKMMLIFPFEEEIHKKAGVNAEFVGHPLITRLPPKMTKSEICNKYNLDENKNLVGIFPGSRKIEINFLLEPYIKGALLIKEKLPDTEFILAQSSNISNEYLTNKLKIIDPQNKLNLKIIKNANYEILSSSDALILTSGTVTLEAAIYNTPMILAYKSYGLAFIIYLFVRYIKFLGLPNIILNKHVVPELHQHQVKPELISEHIIQLLTNPEKRNKMLTELQDVKKLLTDKNASHTVATLIFKELT